ncbi:MAG: ribonuclease III [Bauldia litoralis]
MSIVERRIATLYVSLGHAFSRPELLEEALTHPSATAGEGRGKRNFERLEFLGDRVLGLVVSTLLLQRYADEKVGALARRHTALVRSETLTRVAQAMGLGEHIIMAQSEEDSGGRDNPQTLADCCEAVIGAIYMDGGLEAATRMIQGHWAAIIDEVVQPPKDPKTALQEWAQSRGLPLPVYSTLERTGPDHDPMFEIQCELRGLPRVKAKGRSKRAAEQGAAQRLLRLVRTHRLPASEDE